MLMTVEVTLIAEMVERLPRETGSDTVGLAGLYTQHHSLYRDTVASRAWYRVPHPDARHSLMISGGDWTLGDPQSIRSRGYVLRPVPLAEGTTKHVRVDIRQRFYEWRTLMYPTGAHLRVSNSGSRSNSLCSGPRDWS